MNQLTEKAKVGKVVRTRELLEKLRVDMMKAYPIKKYLKAADYMGSGRLTSGSMTWLQEIGCIQDCSEPGVSSREGRLFKWTYQGTETGVVDSKLVDILIEKERKYQKDWRDQRREGIQALAAGTVKQENGITKLPTGKKDNIHQIVQWIDSEVGKNELVPGYLKAQEAVMLPRIKEVLTGLEDLKQCITNLNL